MHEAISALKSFPWDSEQELVTVSTAEVKVALRSFLGGELTAGELEAWANGIEVRDDIAFRPREITDLITEIANPVLFAALDARAARELLIRADSLPTSRRVPNE